MDLGLVSPGAWCAVDLGEPQLSSCCHLPSPNPLYKIKPLAQDSDLSHTLSALDYCRVLCGHDLSLYLWSIAEVLFLLRQNIFPFFFFLGMKCCLLLQITVSRNVISSNHQIGLSGYQHKMGWNRAHHAHWTLLFRWAADPSWHQSTD